MKGVSTTENTFVSNESMFLRAHLNEMSSQIHVTPMKCCHTFKNCNSGLDSSHLRKKTEARTTDEYVCKAATSHKLGHQSLPPSVRHEGRRRRSLVLRLAVARATPALGGACQANTDTSDWMAFIFNMSVRQIGAHVDTLEQFQCVHCSLFYANIIRHGD